MKNRKKLIAMIASILIVASAAVTVVYAYLYQANKKLTNTLTPAQVSCQVEETRNGNEKEKVTVKNTSTYDAYIRIVAVTYWQDTKGNVVGHKFSNVNNINIASLISSDWFAGGDNIYYYKHKVGAEKSTSNLINSTIVLDKTSKKESGVTFEYYQVVEFIAEAIQAAPVSAVENSWTDVKVDGEGNLIPNTAN